MPPTCRLPSSILLSSSILAATSSCWWLCLSWSIAAACWWFSSERKEASYGEQKEQLICKSLHWLTITVQLPQILPLRKHTQFTSGKQLCCHSIPAAFWNILHHEPWLLSPSKKKTKKTTQPPKNPPNPQKLKGKIFQKWTMWAYLLRHILILRGTVRSKLYDSEIHYSVTIHTHVYTCMCMYVCMSRNNGFGPACNLKIVYLT